MIATFLRWFIGPLLLLAAVGMAFGNPWLLAKIVGGIVMFVVVVAAIGRGQRR